MSNNKRYEVAPNGKRWKVKKQGNQKASRTFDTQKDAINYGKKRAKQDKTELQIKNRKGQIRDSNSYGNDPYPPKG